MPTSRVLRHVSAVIAIISIVWGLNALSTHYPQYGDQTYQTLLDGVFPRLHAAEAITIGGSVAIAIDFDTLGQVGEHLHLPGNDLFGAEAVLAATLPRTPRLRTVYLPVAPEAFGLDNGAKGRWHYRRRQLYRALARHGYRYLIDGDWQTAIVAWYLPLVRQDRWQRPAYMFVRYLRGLAPLDEAPLPVTPNGRYRPHFESLREREDKVDSEFGRESFFHISDNERLLYHDKTIPYRNATVLLRIVNLLAARNIEPVLFSPPVSAMFQRYLSASAARLLPSYNAVLSELKKDGIAVLDYRTDEEFYHDSSLFWDPHHLNERGRVVFSKRLRTDLERRQTRSHVSRMRASTMN